MYRYLSNRGSVCFPFPEPNSPKPGCKCGSAIAGLVSGSRWARTSTWTLRLRQRSTRPRRSWASRPVRSSQRRAANTELTASTVATTITRPPPRQTSIRPKVSTLSAILYFSRRYYLYVGPYHNINVAFPSPYMIFTIRSCATLL